MPLIRQPEQIHQIPQLDRVHLHRSCCQQKQRAAFRLQLPHQPKQRVRPFLLRTPGAAPPCVVRFVQNEQVPISGIEQLPLTVGPPHQETGHKHIQIGVDLPDDAGVRWVDPSANVCLVDRSVPPKLAGHALSAIERSGEIRVVAVRRLGVGIVATPDLVFQEGDVVYMSVANDHLGTVDALLSPDRDPNAQKAGH